MESGLHRLAISGHADRHRATRDCAFLNQRLPHRLVMVRNGHPNALERWRVALGNLPQPLPDVTWDPRFANCESSA